MLTNFPIGQIVKSISGRDINHYYMVIGIDTQNRILVVDGKYKLLCRPKPKNPLHLKKVNYIDNVIATKLKNGQKINDQMIYHAIHEYHKVTIGGE